MMVTEKTQALLTRLEGGEGQRMNIDRQIDRVKAIIEERRGAYGEQDVRADRQAVGVQRNGGGAADG